MHARENTLYAGCLQPEHALEQSAKHRAVVGQNRIIAILKKIGLIDLDLFADDAAAIDAAAHYPVDAAMAVIGAAVAVLAEGAAEFGDHDDDSVSPSRRSDLFGKSGQRTAEFAETVGEITGRRALVDMGIPAADIDKAEVELLAHQPADPPRRQLKAARRNRAAIGRGHFLRYRTVNVVANPKTLRNRGSKIALRVHVPDQFGLTIVDTGLAHAVDSDVWNLRLAAEDQRQLVGKGNRLDARQLSGEPAHGARTIIARGAGRLAEVDRILG